MMRTTRLLGILTLCFFAMSLTIGCGGGDEPASSSSESSQSDAPPAEDDESPEEPEEATPEEDSTEPESPAEEKESAEKPKTTTSNGAKGTGSVSGVIKFKGAAPELPVLIQKGDKTAKDSEVCAAEAVPDESLVVNKENNGIANVFVYMRKAPEGAPEADPASEPIIFDQ